MHKPHRFQRLRGRAGKKAALRSEHRGVWLQSPQAALNKDGSLIDL